MLLVNRRAWLGTRARLAILGVGNAALLSVCLSRGIISGEYRVGAIQKVENFKVLGTAGRYVRDVCGTALVSGPLRVSQHTGGGRYQY